MDMDSKNQTTNEKLFEASSFSPGPIEFDMSKTWSESSEDNNTSEQFNEVPLKIRGSILEALTRDPSPTDEVTSDERDDRLDDLLPDELICDWMDHKSPRLVEVTESSPETAEIQETYSDEIISINMGYTEAENALVQSLEETLKSFDINVADGMAQSPKHDAESIPLEDNTSIVTGDTGGIAIESNITFVKQPVDPIEEILSRNDKAYKDIHIENDRQKALKPYYVPSFLSFFIALLIITTLLFYYTSTYI